jgi:putative ABC transport system permease protein
LFLAPAAVLRRGQEARKKQDLTPDSQGIVLGLVAASGLTRFLGSLLYEVEARDPATYVGVAVVLIGVALAATLIPVTRATGIDPLVALRAE